MLRVLYFVHDLSDPAVRRRVAMLEAGGADVTLAGFRRAGIPPELERLSPVDLGRTRDGKFVQRIAAVAAAALSLGAKLKGVAKPDVIIGRNLEMLALAVRARAQFAAEAPVVYECLDIHRLLLGQNVVSRAMRGAERWFGREAALLVTSSPAFVRDYFQRFGQIDAPVALLSNKVLDLAGTPEPPGGQRTALSGADKPWVVGWFGALRCRSSLELLAAFSRRMEGRFEIVLRGRPARSELPDFERFVAAEPFMRFEGAYRNPEDLARIYGEVHFSWAIDFFEAGLNSDWLLPNRLYEGCRYGAVPIAMRHTETGRFLAGRGMGLLLDEASPAALAGQLGSLDGAAYASLRDRILAQDRATWVCDLGDCRALVERLAGLPARTAGRARLQVA